MLFLTRYLHIELHLYTISVYIFQLYLCLKQVHTQCIMWNCFIGFATSVTRPVPHVEQVFCSALWWPLRFPRGAGITKLSGAPEFTPVFSGGRVDRSLVFCVVFCRLLCVLLSFHFGIDVRFWLPLLYIQSFLSAIDC